MREANDLSYKCEVLKKFNPNFRFSVLYITYKLYNFNMQHEHKIIRVNEIANSFSNEMFAQCTKYFPLHMCFSRTYTGITCFW